MKDSKQLKTPPINQINWFKKTFDAAGLAALNNVELKSFYLSKEVLSACCGESYVTQDHDGSNDLTSKFYLELHGESPQLTEDLMLMLSLAIHDAEDIEYYEIASNMKIIIEEICEHPDTKEKYNQLPAGRIFPNPNLK